MKLRTITYPVIIGIGLSLATLQAATLFSNAVDTNFLETGNWNNGVPDGTNGAGRITDNAQLSADHNAGGSNIIIGFGSAGALTVDSLVTLTTTARVDVGRVNADAATGSLTLNGTLVTDTLNVIDGTLTVASSVDLQGTTTIYAGGTLSAGGTIDMKANAGSLLYFNAGSSVTGSPNVLQLRNSTTVGFEIDAAGNHAVIAGNSMQVRFGSSPDLVVDFLSAPTIGQTFDLMTGVEKFANYQGADSGYTFQDVTINGLGAGQDYNLIYNVDTPDAGFLRLEVTAVPEPSSSALIGLGGLALILRRRK